MTCIYFSCAKKINIDNKKVYYMKQVITMPESKFLKVACKNCKNQQIIFNKPSTLVKCLKCGEILAEPTGGEAVIKGKILQPLS